MRGSADLSSALDAFQCELEGVLKRSELARLSKTPNVGLLFYLRTCLEAYFEAHLDAVRTPEERKEHYRRTIGAWGGIAARRTGAPVP